MAILENSQESEEVDATKIWHKTACVLCSANCGLEVRLEGRDIIRVKGNKAHVASAGYTCEKGLRINHYQNNTSRLTSPLKRFLPYPRLVSCPTTLIIFTKLILISNLNFSNEFSFNQARISPSAAHPIYI